MANDTENKEKQIDITAAEKSEQEAVSKQQKKEITTVCDISINQIFTALHFKAVEQAGAINKNIKIQNSAIDGDDEKSAKFYGAGQHIIAAIPLKSEGLDEDGITKEQALPSLQTYIQWFSGPDIKITEEMLNPLEMSGQDKEKAKDISNSKKDSVAGEKYQKESIYVPTFSQYLILEAGENEENKNSDEKEPEAKETSNQKQDTDDNLKQNADGEKAKGWFITFKLDIKGQKEHTLSDALKNFGKKMLEGFGVQSFDWRSGATGEVKTIGDMLDSLDAVFGKIDPDELIKKYNDNFKKVFPQSEAQSQIWDTKTIKQHLKKNLDTKSLTKLKNAELALCTRVDKRDKSYKLYNSQLIADTVTKSIQGLFKKFKNKVTKNDVIMVNNYSDDKKDKEEKIYTGDKAEGAVADSIMSRLDGNLLTEAAKEKLTVGQVSSELQKLVQSGLKEYDAISQVATSEKIVEKLAKAGIDEPRLFEELKKAKYSFLIRTKEKVQEDVSSSQKTKYNLLTQLFEKQLDAKKLKDTTVIDKVKKVFDKLIIGFKQYSAEKDLKTAAIDTLAGHISDKQMKESIAISKTLSFMNILYEDIDNDSIKMIFESNKGIPEINEVIDRVGAKNISANKDKINGQIRYHYNNQNQNELKKKIKSAFEKIYEFDNADDLKDYIEKTYKGYKQDKNGIGRIANAIAVCLSEAGLPDKEDEEPKEEPPKKEEIHKIPEEVEKFNIGFMDKDPESNELDDPEYIEVQRGGSVTPPKPKYETDKHKFNGWRDSNGNLDDFDDIQEPKSYRADYAKEVELDKFNVTFQDWDPETNEITVIDEQTVNKGGAAKEPKIPEHEGWKFAEWSAPFDNVTAPIETMTIWTPDIKIITKAPEDPEKPTTSLKEIGDPIEYDPKKPLEKQLPEHPEKEGWESDGWDPDPKEVKNPKENIEIIAKYKKSGSKDGMQEVYYVIPDENGMLNSSEYTIAFIQTDPDKPDDESKWKTIGDEIKVSADKVDDIIKKYPKDSDVKSDDSHKFIGWSPSAEDLKKNGIEHYYDDPKTSQEDKDGNKKIIVKSIYSKDQFTVHIVNPDPEDPENTKAWKDVANIVVIDVDGKKYYKVADLRQLAKDAESKDLSDKYSKIADENEKAFKEVDNLKGYESKPYKLLKDEPWNPPFEKAIEDGPKDGEDEVLVKAQYENAIKTNHTELDFYIVPMKGLSYNTRKAQKEEGNK